MCKGFRYTINLSSLKHGAISSVVLALHRGSKLRSPSPIALVEPYRATLISHSLTHSSQPRLKPTVRQRCPRVCNHDHSATEATRFAVCNKLSDCS
ncbi:hypothetical protein TNCV_2622541 [Trichonephila clavipes]|uniref:Uncharacterized protein n=1 Tax=Trichonephila clavipes TaxID=2585209 RepID=A0A8X7BIY1_TRICX|nr:hypothetical protein TNCV_2622541 [Trichonephila clavipes]